MAVRVMVAPAITQLAKKAGPSAARGGSAPAKPKRRRSSVYDADGNEVFITLMCLKCHKMRPLSQFGLRKMADGAIRNQPWCRTCRSASGAEKGGRSKDDAAVAEAPAVEVRAAEPAQAAAQEAPPKRTGAMAAEVAAALAGGMRR